MYSVLISPLDYCSWHPTVVTVLAKYTKRMSNFSTWIESSPIGFQSTLIRSIRVQPNWISIYLDPIHSGPLQLDFNLLGSNPFGSNPVEFQSTWIQSIRFQPNWISIYSDPIYSDPPQLNFNLVGSNPFGSNPIGFQSTWIQFIRVRSNWI